jgi:hypothetical protein
VGYHLADEKFSSVQFSSVGLVVASRLLMSHSNPMEKMERLKKISWHEAHFSSMSSQTTLYGFSKIRKQNDTDKFVVASVDSNFMSVEYNKIGDKVSPLSKNIQFANIPVPGEVFM